MYLKLDLNRTTKVRSIEIIPLHELQHCIYEKQTDQFENYSVNKITFENASEYALIMTYFVCYIYMLVLGDICCCGVSFHSFRVYDPVRDSIIYGFCSIA